MVDRHLGGTPLVKADFRLCLSHGEPPEVSLRNQGLLLEPGTKVLLCSDGLSDHLEAAEIRQALLDHEPPAAVDALLQLARQRHCNDDLSLIVAQV